jgi:hypothetical protein
MIASVAAPSSVDSASTVDTFFEELISKPVSFNMLLVPPSKSAGPWLLLHLLVCNHKVSPLEWSEWLDSSAAPAASGIVLYYLVALEEKLEETTMPQRLKLSTMIEKRLKMSHCGQF